MINLPPGSPNAVAPNVTPTWIFTPTPGEAATVSIYNDGMYPVFIGRSGVSQPDGFPIAPGNKPVRLQNINYPLYAVAHVTVGAQGATVATAALTAGTTTITMTGTPSLATQGTYVVGSTVNTGWEVFVVSSISGATVTTTTPLTNDHAGGSPVYSATALGGSLVVQAGVV